MRIARVVAVALVLLIAVGASLDLLAQDDAAEMKKPQGPYLGQTPPGTTPVVFSPGFACKAGRYEYGCTFYPDGSEFYFSRDGNTWFTLLKPKGWALPKRARWNTSAIDMEPHITADGTKLMYSSNRWSPDSPQPCGVWVLDRVGSGWGKPRYHGPGMYPTTAFNGNLYLTDTSSPIGDRIAVQRFEAGEYGPLEPLGDAVNGFLPSAHPCIAPDESYLIFDSPRPGTPEGPWHLFISFRLPDGSWSQAARIEEAGEANIASLSPDGIYLFFTHGDDIYWVSSEIVERYRPDSGAWDP